MYQIIEPPQPNVILREELFDYHVENTSGHSTPVFKITWTNCNKVSVEVITYGATITAIKVPNKFGFVEDIVMGFIDLKGYRFTMNPYIGATIGRVANRIASGRFGMNGRTFGVSLNSQTCHLHGGYKGFDKVNWHHNIEANKVVMSYLSVDGEEGYPGDLITNVSFELTASNEFLIDFKAHTSKPTYVNLTHHSYFNLGGHNGGPDELYQHIVTINADKITEVDEDFIPTGRIIPIGGTVFDFRIPKVLGNYIPLVPACNGFDHNFCITKAEGQGECFVARVHHPNSGRVLEVYSNQPGVQFYTANGLPDHPKDFLHKNVRALKTLVGKTGPYYKHGAFCLQTQNYPDAINHPGFPKAVLNPGETYHHTLTYKFYLE